MIEFYSEEVGETEKKEELKVWITGLITEEGFKEGDICFIFCTDEYLLDINVKHLNHNYLTDVISFDYGMGKLLAGDIFISVDRVKDNAVTYAKTYQEELHRVMAHGILHFCGYKDKTLEDQRLMRQKEDYYLSLRTF